MPARVWFLSIIIWSAWSGSLPVSAQEVKAVTEWNLKSADLPKAESKRGACSVFDTTQMNLI